jgi:hypothetical protein
MRDQSGSRQRVGGRVRPGQAGPRLLTAAMALLVAAAAVSCGTSTPSGPRNGPAGASSSWGIVSIPTGANAYVKCMRDAGWQLTEFSTPQRPGGEPGYGWIHPGPMDSAAWEVHAACSSIVPFMPTDSPDDIREMYNRWVGEYECLIGLGYRPDPPTSVEVFVASYLDAQAGNAEKHSYWWWPLQGVDTDSWTKAQYDEARAKCTLENWSDSRYLH